MSESVVAKFGGSSMACPEQVAGIVEQRPDQQIIIVSAPGMASGFDEKMTDTLIRYAHMAKKDHPDSIALRDEIVERMDGLYSMLGETERAELRETTAKQLAPTRHDTANYFISHGEIFSANYFARLIGATCLHPAVRFDGAGQLNRAATSAAIREQVERHPERLVIPGFFGADEFNRTWLLGRGGSDRTGAFYATALDQDYENWSDVDGIYSADPRIVGNARVIPVLTREEVREGAHGGSGILQGDTIVDLNGTHITTTLKNTFNPAAQGTRILSSLRFPRHAPVVAVSGRDDLLQVNIRDLGMSDRRGYVAEALGQLSELGLSFEHLPSSQDSFSVTLAAKNDKEKIDEFVDFAKSHRLSSQGTVKVNSVGAVYVIGEDLRRARIRQEVLVRILGTLAADNISALPIMNVDSPSLALLVERQRVKQVVRDIHAQEIEQT